MPISTPKIPAMIPPATMARTSRRVGSCMSKACSSQPLTTAPVTLTDGLERLLSPLKVIHFPAHEMAMMMTIALRFIPTLLRARRGL